MSTNGLQERWGRETRLLVLVVVVSIALLLVLARFRFPTANLTVATPAPGPLAGLVGRTTFDDLGSSLNTLLARVSPRFSAVRMAPRATAVAGRAVAAPAVDLPPAQIFPALRVQPDLAIVYVPPGSAPAAMESGAPVDVVAHDPARGLAVVRMPSVADLNLDPVAGTFGGFAYVGELNSTLSGLGVRPEFLGRLEPVIDAQWPAPILAATSTPELRVGSFVFTMDGHLVGLVMRGTAGPVIVPADALARVVQGLVRTGTGPS